MPPSPQLLLRLNGHYPKPKVDPEWLNACYDWVIEEYQLQPAADLDTIYQHVESQLLQSDLRDSMIPRTGLPPNISEMNDQRITGPPVLVQITALTDIGHSAFSLQNVRQTRIDRADLSGLAGDNDEDDDDDEGPVPNYPRSMLRFELSDGSQTVNAIEFRKLDGLILGETPLGFKMVVRNVLIRRGIAFLEPKYVTMKGHQTEDLNEKQDQDFVRSLRLRMGFDDDPDAEQQEPEDHGLEVPEDPAAQAIAQLPVEAPAPVPAVVRAPSGPGPRSPLRELTRSPSPTLIPSYYGDEVQPNRRRIPSRSTNAPATGSSAIAAQSPYFPSTAGQSSSTRVVNQVAASRMLSQTRTASLIEIGDTDNESKILPPALTSNARPAVAPKPLALTRSEEGTQYDFGDDVIDEAMFQGIEKIEKEYGSQYQSTSGGYTQLHVAGTSSSSYRAQTGNVQTNGDYEVIMIDDEEDDKENVPVPTRRVRRRIEVNEDDVIDISDD